MVPLLNPDFMFLNRELQNRTVELQVLNAMANLQV